MSQNLTETLASIQRLTERNLEILKALNDSFYSKREHISAVIGDEVYNIPSFLYLESKIGDLENNFENLVNAPKTGTAAFVFDGNSQEIQLKGFSTTPDPLSLKQVENFDVEQNKIFKDLLSPNPYIRLDLSEIGNDVTEVVVKKIDIKNTNLLSQITGISSEENTVDYAGVLKILSVYESDKDFVEYDTIRRLPVKADAPYGRYTIKKIENNWTDENLEQHYILILNEKLNYWTESGTLQRSIYPGNELITSNDVAKLRVDRLDYSKNLVEVTVENGAFADLAEYNAGYQNNDYAILKYFSIVGQDSSKYVDVPLEEDKNLLVFVSVLDSRLNIQGPWGTGLLIDTDNLTIEVRGEEGKEDVTIYTFSDYYKNYINNIGDTLFGLTKMFQTDIFNWTSDEYNTITNAKPKLNPEILRVVEINSHLNDSESVKKIRSLHNQKSSYKSELSTVQADIDKLDDMLSQLSFSDTVNNRMVYESQMRSLNAKKAELNKNITEIVNEISDDVNSADVPLENAAYHIRGFFDVDAIEAATGHKVIRIDTEYRYKNRNRSTGSALSIADEENTKTYIYSDWNKMPSFVDQKRLSMSRWSQTISVEYPESTDELNVPSFNQIDIPITQGESVDIRLRVQYADGYPFVEVLSNWSDILNVEFPEEFISNIPVMRIIDINNEDAEIYRFRGLLESEGVIEHVGDKVQDQDKLYFHHPENIASGFFTPERRVIPLKDKLSDLNDKVNTLMDELYSMDPSQLNVTVSDDRYTIKMTPYGQSTFYAPAYNNTTTDTQDSNGNAVDIININISNPTNHNIKLFTMFPGNSATALNGSIRSKFDIKDYYNSIDYTNPLSIYGYSNGIQIEQNTRTRSGHQPGEYFEQHQNQILYFRLNNPYNGTMYYDDPEDSEEYASNVSIFEYDNILSGRKLDAVTNGHTIRKFNDGAGASLCMNLNSLNDILTVSNARYITLRPGDSVTVPLEFRYKVVSDGSQASSVVTRGGGASDDVPGDGEGGDSPDVITDEPGGNSHATEPVGGDNEGGDTDTTSNEEPGASEEPGSGEGGNTDNAVSEPIPSDHIQKTVSFDLWTSLFADPINYTLTIRANYIDDLSLRKRYQTRSDRYTPTVISSQSSVK